MIQRNLLVGVAAYAALPFLCLAQDVEIIPPNPLDEVETCVGRYQERFHERMGWFAVEAECEEKSLMLMIDPNQYPTIEARKEVVQNFWINIFGEKVRLK